MELATLTPVGEGVGNVIYLIDRSTAGQTAGMLGLGALAFVGLMQLILGRPMDRFNLIGAIVLLVLGSIGAFACWRAAQHIKTMPAAEFVRGIALDLDKKVILHMSTKQPWATFADARTVSYIWSGDWGARYTHWNTHIVANGQHVLVTNRDVIGDTSWAVAAYLDRIGIAPLSAPGTTNYWEFRNTYNLR